MDPMEANEESNISPRENVLYLLAELERAFERDGTAWATHDAARVQERLTRIMVRLVEARSDVEESFPITHPPVTVVSVAGR
jgi:hypothetical protein